MSFTTNNTVVIQLFRLNHENTVEVEEIILRDPVHFISPITKAVVIIKNWIDINRLKATVVWLK